MGVRRVPLRLPLRRSGRVRVAAEASTTCGAPGRRRRAPSSTPRSRRSTRSTGTAPRSSSSGRPRRPRPRSCRFRVDGLDWRRFEVLRPPRELDATGPRVGCRSPSTSRRAARSPTASTAADQPWLRRTSRPAPAALVMIHGGPTAAAASPPRLTVQYWTSRGFAVVDVNYCGSTGFGRSTATSCATRGASADVEDCGPRPLAGAAEGRVDPARLCIRRWLGRWLHDPGRHGHGDTFSAAPATTAWPTSRRSPWRHAQVREPVPRPVDRAVPRTKRRVRRALTDPSPGGFDRPLIVQGVWRTRSSRRRSRR